MIGGWSKLKSHFGVSYRQIPQAEYAEALSIVSRHAVEALEGELLPREETPKLKQDNDSHIEGLAILSKGARVQAVQAEKLQEALAKFNHASLLLNEAIRCCGAVASGFSEAKPRLNATAEERQKAAVRATEMFESWESKQFFS